MGQKLLWRYVFHFRPEPINELNDYLFLILEGKIAEAKAELKSLCDAILSSKHELSNQEEYLKKYRDEVKAKEAQLEKELSIKMKQMKVVEKEVEEAATPKAELTKKGLNLSTLLKLAKEFNYGSKQS